MVKRYDIDQYNVPSGESAEMEQSEFGEWVSYSDYQKLESEVSRLKAELTRFQTAPRSDERARPGKEEKP